MLRHPEKTTETVTIIFCVTSPHTECKAFFFISIKKSLQAFAKHSRSKSLCFHTRIQDECSHFIEISLPHGAMIFIHRGNHG